jgi:DNA replication initiation complex subunit (GINS family)
VRLGGYLDYQDLYDLWINERASVALQKIPADFYIVIDGRLAILHQMTQVESSEWEPLRQVVLRRMEFLRKDISQLRLVKILNAVTHNITLDEDFLTWGELKLHRDLTRSIQTVGFVTQDLTVSTEYSDDPDDYQNDLPVSSSPPKELPRIMVRMLTDVEKIVGIDNREYGPFSENDIVNLPQDNAKALISKGVARLIKASLSGIEATE